MFLLPFFTKQNSTQFKLIFVSCLRRRMSFEMHYIFSRRDFIGRKRFVSQFPVTKREGDPSSLSLLLFYHSSFISITNILMSCSPSFFLVIIRCPLFLISFLFLLHQQDLERVFKDCQHPVCGALKSKYRFVLEKFKVSASLDDLPDLSPLMRY